MFICDQFRQDLICGFFYARHSRDLRVDKYVLSKNLYARSGPVRNKKCTKYHRCSDKNKAYMNYRMFTSPRVDREKGETEKGGAIESFIVVTLYWILKDGR